MRASRLILTGAIAAATLSLGACNKPAANTAATDTTAAPAPAATPAGAATTTAAVTSTAPSVQSFVTAAATSDMYEVAAAKIALGKGAGAQVKAFAQRMIHDHTASTAKLKALIAAGSVVASAPAKLDDAHQALIDRLKQAQTPDFDKIYMDQQIAAHQDAMSLFGAYAAHGDNAALEGFVAAVTPTVQDHLAMARQTRASMK